MVNSLPSVQIAPNHFIAEEDYEDFLDDLESDDGDALAAYLSLVRDSRVELTRDNVDDALWSIFQPIFAYFNWQIALKAGDEYALALHKAVQLTAVEQSARRATVRRSVDQMLLRYGSH